jgi:hypothetical protein
MPWQPAGHDEDGIDANVVTRPRVAGGEPLGGDRDTAEAIFVEREGGGIFAAPLLHFHEGDRLSALRNEIDFTAVNTRSPSENSPAMKPQPPGREGFRAPPPRFRDVAIQALPAKSSALA